MKNLAGSFYNWYKLSLRNSKYRWFIVGGTLLYLLSPIDISPDFIPIIGWIDDGIVASLLIAEVSSMLTDFLSNRTRKASNVDTDENSVIDVPVE